MGRGVPWKGVSMIPQEVERGRWTRAGGRVCNQLRSELRGLKGE